MVDNLAALYRIKHLHTKMISEELQIRKEEGNNISPPKTQKEKIKWFYHTYFKHQLLYSRPDRIHQLLVFFLKNLQSNIRNYPQERGRNFIQN